MEMKMTLDETLRKAAVDGLSIKAALEVAAVEHPWIDRAWLTRWCGRTGIKIRDGRSDSLRNDDPAFIAKQLAGIRARLARLAAEKSHSGT